ncbi:YifB family Mg chelatase-like AAA ATPase [Helicobacter cetorum]|uniref:YifB family Mg chelatase-like AAA ATPase n=1 Tax=Helicobacter cetorum TaxID=138563 RepID=UPI000CF08659|nr:YifB family Mg chelatase-like AAA ATPase [Helicobacter cetorum]
MINTIYCATMQRGLAEVVAVEATFTRALPAFVISGLANNSIQEAKQRVQSALQNNNFTFPPLKITINLSPSDLPKSGSHFDLPIALLVALQKQELALKEWFAFGELGLDGKIKYNQNIFPMLLDIAIKHPNAQIIVPKAGKELISLIPNLQCFFVEHFKEALEILQNPESKAHAYIKNLPFKTIEIDNKEYYFSNHYELDFKEVRGQNIAKEAVLIASAGFHNLLLEGSPGCGKSMMVNRMRYILPPLSLNEILETTKLRILSEQEGIYSPLRSFRNPHQSASKSSILGSSSLKEPKPGEVALAHNGLLFFDELPHFKKDILEALREPLENNKLVISRVHSKIEYNTSFLFVGALNPCPCGNLLSQTKVCRCQDREITQYKNRLSEPFLDRIDLFVQMEETSKKENPSQNVWTSENMHQKVLQVFKHQKERQQSAFNGKLNEAEILQFCPLNSENQNLLDQAIERFGLSMRSVNKIKKVARTIADLNDCQEIEKSHILKALSFRKIS